ncbi:MAG: efflux RND transporter permease subunit [Armatimonadota bacterium]
MSLTQLSIKRPIAIFMLFAVLAILGLQGLFKMPAEQDPRIDFPFISVSTVYPGAGPGEIETLISKPIEDAVFSVNGIKNVTSVSQQGISIVAIEFQLGVDVDTAAADVRAKVDSVRRALPQAADVPLIGKFDTGSAPIMFLAVRSTSGRDSREIRDLCDRTIKDRLSQVAGVAAVNVIGGDKREIGIQLNRGRLDALGLTVTDVVNAVRAQNLNLPAGRVTESVRDYAVRVVGEFKDANEIADLEFTAQLPSGPKSIRLRDIADVRDTARERTESASLAKRDSSGTISDSTDTVTLSVQKISGGNTVDIARGIEKQIAAAKALLPADIEITTTSNQAKEVKENLLDVQHTLIIGAVLAVLIVYLFLHNLRGTLIVAIAIPASIVSTFLVMQALGFTLNSMTLLGLSLAVGILVDDSIVVLENIYKFLALGYPPDEAALKGRGEIGLAALTITLVDVVVFVPVAFMGGIVGQFFRSFGVTVAVATLFSLLVSFTLAPMLASKWYQQGFSDAPTSKFARAFDAFFHSLSAKYRNALHWALLHRGTVIFIGNMALVNIILWMITAGSGGKASATAIPLVAIQAAGGAILFGINRMRGKRSTEPLIVGAIGAAVSFAVCSVSGIVGTPLGFRFAPGIDQSLVSLSVELPAGSSLGRTNQALRKIEEAVRDIPEIDYIELTAGSTSTGGFESQTSSGSNFGQVRLILGEPIGNLDRLQVWKDSSNLRRKSDVEVAELVRARTKDIVGADVKTTEVSGFGGTAAPVQIIITGPDLSELLERASAVKDVLSKTDGILTPDVSYKPSKPEVRIVLDRRRAADYGMTVQQVAGVLRDAIEGNIESKLRIDGEQYDIRIQYQNLNRSSVTDVGNVIIGYRNGLSVRVRDIARIYEDRGPTKIDRRNRLRQVTVSAYLAPGKVIGNMQQAIDPQLAKINFGRASYTWGGEANTMAEEGVFMISALLLAIGLVYILMAALFDNLLYPLVIMLSIPQALVGGLLGLLITGKPLSIIAMIGVIMLMGLVTKNAILLVDYTNNLRREGKDRFEALLESGPARLRPILMTSLAQILGAWPVAAALGRGSEFRQPLGIVVMSGLILSGLLTLLVIPCTYILFDDISEFLSRKRSKV